MSDRLLVTTSRALYELDVDSDYAREVHAGSGLYYGLDAHDGRVYVGTRNRLASSRRPMAGERGCVLVFDRELSLAGRLCSSVPLRDVHELRWHEGRLFVTCPFDDAVAIYEAESGDWRMWHPTGHRQRVHHFNTVRFLDGEGALIAHNFGHSQVLFFDVDTLEIIRRQQLGYYAHGLWRENGELKTCSSGQGLLVGDRGFRLGTGGYPRGVAFSRDHAYVGVSQTAERHTRDFTCSAVHVYTRDWKSVKSIRLPPSGMVLDLMLRS